MSAMTRNRFAGASAFPLPLAATALALSLPLAAIVMAPLSHADDVDGCGPTMFFNTATNQCEYYAWVGPGPVGPGPVGPGPVGPGPVGPGR